MRYWFWTSFSCGIQAKVELGRCAKNKINDEANFGGKTGVVGGEGGGEKTKVDYPWTIDNTSTIVIRGNRFSAFWCVSSGLVTFFHLFCLFGCQAAPSLFFSFFCFFFFFKRLPHRRRWTRNAPSSKLWSGQKPGNLIQSGPKPWDLIWNPGSQFFHANVKFNINYLLDWCFVVALHLARFISIPVKLMFKSNATNFKSTSVEWCSRTINFKKNLCWFISFRKSFIRFRKGFIRNVGKYVDSWLAPLPNVKKSELWGVWEVWEYVPFMRY